MENFVTVGALVVSVLTITAEATLKGLVGETAKDLYKALKTQVGKWAFDDVDKLAETPTAGRKLVVAEAIDGQSESDRAKVEKLARMILNELRQPQSTAVGIDVDLLRSRLVDLSGLEVSNGIGLRAREVDSEEFVVRNMKVVGGGAEKKS